MVKVERTIQHRLLTSEKALVSRNIVVIDENIVCYAIIVSVVFNGVVASIVTKLCLLLFISNLMLKIGLIRFKSNLKQWLLVFMVEPLSYWFYLFVTFVLMFDSVSVFDSFYKELFIISRILPFYNLCLIFDVN